MSTEPTTNNQDLKEGISKLGKYFRNVIDLSKGVDKRSVIEEISLKKSMSGANSWMLMCSIVIASIGLDINSIAIIIGAMLISPLMSPILAIGLGVAINDKDMLKDALFQFSIAVGIAIVTSTIYFAISPFGEITEQIRLRTEPTPLDIPIAFFGGIAGIVSIARKDISTSLPGVAIATALMPPLCVVGFGLSCGQWKIAASSFYLFLLNIFFVSLATYIIVRFLKFPYKQYLDEIERKKNVRYVSIISVLVIIPSFFIFFEVYDRLRTKHSLDQFIEEYIAEDQIYLDDYQLFETEGKDQLVLKVYGDKINASNLSYLKKGLINKGLKNIEITIMSTADNDLDRMRKLEMNYAGVDDLKTKLDAVIEQQAVQYQQKVNFAGLPNYISMDSSEQVKSVDLLKTAFPTIREISLSYGISSDSLNRNTKSHFAIVDWHDEKQITIEEKKRLTIFLQKQFELENIILR